MSSRKRTRRQPKESESEYEASSNMDESEDECEPSPPPQKRRRRSSRIKRRSETGDEFEESEDSDIENNTNNKTPAKWQKKMSKLQEENVSLKKEIKKLQAEIKSLKTMTASKPAIDGKKYFNGFQKSLIRIAKLKKTRFYGDASTICVEQTLDKDDFEQLFCGKGDKIQPTPSNKPKSVKTIIEFKDWEEVKELFSDYSVTLNQEITG